MNTFNLLKRLSFWSLLTVSLISISCSNDDEVPHEENDLEIITDIKLIFTNELDANDVVEARAEDPDGEGVEELEVLDAINLDANKTYILTFDIENHLAEEEEEEEHEEEEHGHSHGFDITEEIEEEAEEHQIFFSFTNDAFSNPLGNGNIDNASDAINYNDFDENQNPLGLSTTWTTESSQVSGGTFTVRLQHQPDIKTSSSGANDGDTDFELEFVLNIQ